MKTLLTTLNSKFIHSSLALRYLKSYCEDDFKHLHLEEYTINNDLDFILGEIYKKNYDLVCFSCYIWNIKETLELANNLKKVKRNIKILLGGPEVSYDPKGIMEDNPFVDFIIFGEGELTFRELLNYLVHQKGSINEIEGLVYRKDNLIIENKDRDLIQDLDSIPFPYEDFKELENRIIYYESSRGCPFNCQYCLSSTIKGVRYFSLERVKRDLEKLVNANVKQVKFVDRTFNANKKHCLEIMKFLKKIDNGRINFHFEITATLIDDEILEFLSTVRKGLFQFEIGIQSTNTITLEEIKRKVEFDKVNYVCKRLTENKNIHIHLDLIAGLPYEDYDSFLNSLNEVYSLKADKIQLGFLKLLKGSGIRKDKDKHGYIYKESPPYEVLENKYISYRDVLRLKSIEELLEIFYNSHHFDFSLRYVINQFSRFSDFYGEISNYWENNGYHKKQHKKEDIYKLLISFYKEYNLPNLDVFMELCKFDYVRNFRGNLPGFFQGRTIDNFKERCHSFLQDEENIKRYLSDFLGQPAKKIIKRVHFEVFKYDILELENNTNEGSFVYLFNYDKQSGEDNFSKIEL